MCHIALSGRKELSQLNYILEHLYLNIFTTKLLLNLRPWTLMFLSSLFLLLWHFYGTHL